MKSSLLLEKLWTKYDFKPDDNQRAAILHVDGPLYLPAGPGSGKTRVLLWRTVNLIAVHGVEPNAIYLSTFTEKAALQLREGLRALLAAVTAETGKPYDLARMYVGTVHSLCQRIITDRDFQPNRRRARAPSLLDELDQYLYIGNTVTWRDLVASGEWDEDAARQNIPPYFGQTSRSKHSALSSVVSFFNRLSEECVDPAALRPDPKDEVLGSLIAMYKRYRELLEGTGSRLTDFSLLQDEALRVLTAHEHTSSVFRHVIVDEYQDTNTVQERIFFRLASGHKNICVVGDDDQALYRFRGATVENFVQFPVRCQRNLKVAPREIPLVTNYRSRSSIVGFYGSFIDQIDWKRDKGKGAYRVQPKQIKPHRKDKTPAVVASDPANPVTVCTQVAETVSALLRAGKVADPNQIAFLYPSLKSPQVQRMIDALEAEGLRVYAPRAKGFLATPEASVTLGAFALILGRPQRGGTPGREYHNYYDWLDRAEAEAEQIANSDRSLRRFIADRREDVERALRDSQILSDLLAANNWKVDDSYNPKKHQRALVEAVGLSAEAKRKLVSARFLTVVKAREERGDPYRLKYIIKRASSVDWSLLDLFYQLCLFEHWSAMFDAAERQVDPDEGPVANLGLLTDYIARFMEQRAPIISGDLLADGLLTRLFFSSYLYSLHRRGESEFEDAEDPFPKGRIPFLTIHQAKGLEFPVVVLGNPRKNLMGPQPVEQIARQLFGDSTDKEPLSKVDLFDVMRMFYVALSRAKNLLILPQYSGRGQSIFEAFRNLLPGVPTLSNFDIGSVPVAQDAKDETPRIYSYTGDYLAYLRCPRQYMVFRKFDFIPSRSQTMVFGTLVHRTLDDLHNHLIAQRATP